MHRRKYLASVCAAGVATTAGCSTVSGSKTLSEPTVNTESSGRKALIFTENDEELGHLGVDGSVTSDRIDITTEVWHRDGTNVESIELRVWMPETAPDTSAAVAVVSPVEGDSSPPPAVALKTPDQALGTSIEITDFDDLADETISTLDLIVIPGSKTATRLNIHTRIELSGSGTFSSDYKLEGDLQLAYPRLSDK